MNPKDRAREWLDQRSGRIVRVETRIGSSTTTAPITNQGSLVKPRVQRFVGGNGLEDPAPIADLYQVGEVTYNLADIPDEVDVQIPGDAAERLEMTFENGSSQSISVLITVTG